MLGPFKTDDHVKGSRLPRSVSTEQTDDLTLRDAQAHIVDNPTPAISFLEAVRDKRITMWLVSVRRCL